MNFNLLPYDTEAYLVAADYQEEQGFLLTNAIRNKILPLEREKGNGEGSGLGNGDGYGYSSGSAWNYGWGHGNGDGYGCCDSFGDGFYSNPGSKIYNSPIINVNYGFCYGKGHGWGNGKGQGYG